MKLLRLIVVLFSILSLSAASAASLEGEFQAPPDSARPWVYWINMDGHFTREGITADFESMKKAGIGGVIHMDVDVGVPRGKVPFMSQTWQDNFAHAVLECERLGLEFTTITGPGWTGTGGPWIAPEQSMQHLAPVSVNHFNSAWSCIEAASIGHVMGKPIVAAEASTSGGAYWEKAWQETKTL